MPNWELEQEVAWNIILGRKRLDLTQGELADAAGISRRQVSRIENGEMPGFDTLRSIAKALEVSSSQLCETRRLIVSSEHDLKNINWNEKSYGLILRSATGTIHEVNKMISTWTGISHDNLAGNHLRDVLNPHSFEVIQSMRKVYKFGGGFDISLAFGKDCVWLTGRALPLFTIDGKQLGVLAINKPSTNPLSLIELEELRREIARRISK